MQETRAREEGRGKREEGRGKREEGRGKREEGNSASSTLKICLGR